MSWLLQTAENSPSCELQAQPETAARGQRKSSESSRKLRRRKPGDYACAKKTRYQGELETMERKDCRVRNRRRQEAAEKLLAQAAGIVAECCPVTQSG